MRDSEKIKAKVGYVPGEVRYYPNMTAQELLKMTLAFHQQGNTDQIDRLCTVFELDRNKKLGELSLGNKKKVAIAAALVHEPRLLILDEPSNGLDPLMQKRLFEILKERHKDGMTVFMSSHNLNEVQAHCTKAAFIKDGRIIRIEDLTQAQSHAKTITISGAALDVASIERIGGKGVVLDGKTVTFVYEGNMSELVKQLASMELQDLLIENASLESEFLSYYEGAKQS